MDFLPLFIRIPTERYIIIALGRMYASLSRPISLRCTNVDLGMPAGTYSGMLKI
jgi:hypothetical protein